MAILKKLTIIMQTESLIKFLSQNQTFSPAKQQKPENTKAKQVR